MSGPQAGTARTPSHKGQVMRRVELPDEVHRAEDGLDIFSMAKKVVATGELQIAAMLIRGAFHCDVRRIPLREEPCSPSVALLPNHYLAEFKRGEQRLVIELSSGEPCKLPYPQTFLVQACLSRMVVRASADFADWRSTMGHGTLANDIAIYAWACRQARAMTMMFTSEQLELLEKITLDELDMQPSELGYR